MLLNIKRDRALKETITAEWLAEKISVRTVRGIGEITISLIRTGEIPVGAQLPTVRDLAFHLGVSPATISQAWKELRRQKIVAGKGRKGLWVLGDLLAPKPSRLAGIAMFKEGVLDLTSAVPDLALLPSLNDALIHAQSAYQLNLYERTPILPELREVVETRWPYKAESYLATNGGFNAIYSVLHALVRPGAAIAIEMPTTLRVLDIIEDLGAEMYPVYCDEEGPLPDSLTHALQRRPTAFFYQPRAHSVTGFPTSRQRLQDIAEVLSHSDTLIIEDDGLSDVSAYDPISLGTHLPDQVIHIHSFSKSLGPDLRLAVLTSTEKLTAQIQSFRSFSAGWTSRLLQATGAWLLNDAKSMQRVHVAKATYSKRREELQKQLALYDINLQNSGGLCVWIPVDSEQFALVTLAFHGVAALPGAQFSTVPTSHIRVGIGNLTNQHKEVAEIIAAAAGRLVQPQSKGPFFAPTSAANAG